MLAILLFLVNLSWAEIKISSQQYQTQIRPLLTSIEKDFVEILSLFPGYPITLPELWLRSLTLQESGKRWRKITPNIISTKYFQNLEKLKSSLELTQTRLQATQLSEEANEIKLELLKDLTETISSLEGVLNNESKLTGMELSLKLDMMASEFSILLERPIPSLYRAHFARTIQHFIKPLSTLVLRDQNSIYLEKKLYDLNIIWNEHHQIVEKRTTELPRTMKQYFFLINQRWNQIMKVAQRF